MVNLAPKSKIPPLKMLKVKLQYCEKSKLSVSIQLWIIKYSSVSQNNKETIWIEDLPLCFGILTIKIMTIRIFFNEVS